MFLLIHRKLIIQSRPIFPGQTQTGLEGLSVSDHTPLTTGIAPMVIGNIHSQQISVTGLIILPVHVLAEEELIKKIACKMEKIKVYRIIFLI